MKDIQPWSERLETVQFRVIEKTYNRPFAGKPSRDLLFIKLSAIT